MHCGFCLPTCPTYVTLGEEMDSPRGRILLVKEALEGQLELDDALPYLDNCLGCQACVTACPSGVQYGELINSFRAYAEPLRASRTAAAPAAPARPDHAPLPGQVSVAARRARSPATVPSPRFRRVLPEALRVMLDALPRQPLPAPRPLPDFHPAQGPRRARVALLAGCVQQVLAPDIDWATLRVLARNGVETVIPARPGLLRSARAAHGPGRPGPRRSPAGTWRRLPSMTSTRSSPTPPAADRG